MLGRNSGVFSMIFHDRKCFHGAAGLSLLWIISTILIVSALSVGVMNLTNTSTKNELFLSFDVRARYLAESGMNYAESYVLSIKNGANVKISDLNGKVLTSGLQSNEQIDLTVTGPVTTSGINYYTVTSIGTVNNNSSAMAKYKIVNVLNIASSFEDNRDRGIYYTENKAAWSFSGSTASVSALNITDYTGGVSFDPVKTNSANSGNKFTGAIGSFGKGIRAYFKFNFSNHSDADGFIFAIKNATLNSPYDCGGPRDSLTSHGCYIAYAGPGLATWGHGMGIRPPKIGLEFDIYTNSGMYTCTNDGRNDPNSDHMTFVYWGNTNTINNSNLLSSSCPTVDDNVHGVGGGDTTSDPVPMNPSSTSGGFYSTNIQTNKDIPIRIEILRSTSAISDGSVHNGMYKYIVKAWYNCTLSFCSDVSNSYSNPTITDTMYLNSDMHKMFDTFYYGYQVSTGSSTETTTLSYPRIEVIN
jgi:hypothetical protein